MSDFAATSNTMVTSTIRQDMTIADKNQLLAKARDFASSHNAPAHETRPELSLAIVTCMDSRIALFRLFDLDEGDAHIIRNAGGIVTDDVLRSLTVSQEFLDTREIFVIQHTDCGLHNASETELNSKLKRETGAQPEWELGGFPDVDDSVRRSIVLIRECPFIQHKDHVYGFVYDVKTRQLHEVTTEAP